MPTLTIKDIPEALHKALKDQATANSRSLNKEVLQRLESSITLARIDVDQRLSEIDRIRADGVRLDPSLLERALSEGRP